MIVRKGHGKFQFLAMNGAHKFHNRYAARCRMLADDSERNAVTVNFAIRYRSSSGIVTLIFVSDVSGAGKTVTVNSNFEQGLTDCFGAQSTHNCGSPGPSNVRAVRVNDRHREIE